MCAINGFNFNDKNLILKMNQKTSHRGPDGSGIFLDEKVSLGHNRLSIIDLTDKAAQPMKSADGNLIISFNGEIYNFKELKEELKINYEFKTHSDTEVILAAYKEWGKDCVKRFNGIFAFAIWDKEKSELFLARDHAGVKPLYYYHNNGRFIFSSEIKAILEHDIPRVLNREAFNHYLRILYVPEPLTMFEGIYKLPPAHIGTLKNGKFNIDKYYGPECDKKIKISKKGISVDLNKRIIDTVQKQLISDKPLGVYLSGGIDSSTILYSALQSREKMDTFSVGFDLGRKEESEKFNKDFNLARKTAKLFGTKHHEVVVSAEDVPVYLKKAIIHMDEPVSNPTAISMIKLAEFAKQKVDVVLGGDGGDELFGGYERYRLSLIASYYQKLPKHLRSLFNKNKKLKKLNTPAWIERFELFMFQKNHILERVINDEFLDTEISRKFFNKKYFEDNNAKTFEEQFMNTDRQSWLVDQAFLLADKMSMSAGLEVRVPFVDKNLIEYACNIPLKYKVSLFDKKIILKLAFKWKIPDFIFNQPKRGWFSPGAKWLRCPEVYNMVNEALSEQYYPETNELFDWKEIRRILEDHCDKKEYNLTIIWAILTFQIWAKEYNITL